MPRLTLADDSESAIKASVQIRLQIGAILYSCYTIGLQKTLQNRNKTRQTTHHQQQQIEGHICQLMPNTLEPVQI